MYNLKTNDLIECVLFSKNKIRSYIKYRKILYKIKRITPDYYILNTIYEFIDQLNFAFFYCLDDTNRLFIKNSRKDRDDNTKKALIYKDNSVTLTIGLDPNEFIRIEIERHMGYKKTSIEFKNGQAVINNDLEAQLFINCTDIIMDELYKIVKKYRHYRRTR